LIFTSLLFFISSCDRQTANNELYSRHWTEADRTLLLTELAASQELVMESITNLDEDQWNWRADSNHWSIALVVEHLITHDELFFRELQVLSNLPEMTKALEKQFSDDDSILSYSEITPQNSGKSPPYLEPQGRWCTQADAVRSYVRSRKALIDFVTQADIDLRSYYTTSGRGPTQYRDLHQLLLISIAHTERHHKQIENIKKQLTLS